MRQILPLMSAAVALGFASTPPAAAAAKPATGDRVEPKIITGALPSGFTLPEPTNRGGGSASKYGFDALETGQVFGVENKTLDQMRGPVNNANRKYRTEATATDGSKTKVQERSFRAVAVTAEMAKSLKDTPFAKATVLVTRTK